MLPVTSSSLRLFLHLLAASVWVGGQLTLVAVVPVLRTAGREHLRAVARRFQQVAWPAFALAVVTGIWGLLEVSLPDRSGAYLATLAVKLGCVTLSGTAAAVHVLVTAPRVRAATSEPQRRRAAAASGVAEATSTCLALAAMLLGVVLRG